ncbi:MAG: hypothetical protein ABIH84_01335, partial [bacterium]
LCHPAEAVRLRLSDSKVSKDIIHFAVAQLLLVIYSNYQRAFTDTKKPPSEKNQYGRLYILPIYRLA